MVRRYAEVGEYGVYLPDAVIAQEVVQVAEIAAHECKVRVGHDVPFRIFVLVESQQPPAFAQARQYFAGMSAAAECNVYVRSVRADVHSVYARHQ